MKVTLLAKSLPDLSPPMVRGKGDHVTDVINYLCLEKGIFSASPNYSPNKELMKMGEAFEHAIAQMLARTHPTEYFVPGEVYHDGLSGNPDLVHVSNRIWEVKYTFRSSKGDCEVGESPREDHPIFGDKFWKDRTQNMCYCTMMGTVMGGLILCHVKGNYGDEPGSAPRVWSIDYEESELRHNWKYIKKTQESRGFRQFMRERKGG